MKKLVWVMASAISLASGAHAGPFIIDGTDADDHGSASGGSNQDGWLYIQKGLENIATGAGLTRTQKTIAVLGSDAGTQASAAAQSAVALSSILAGAGWNVVLLNDAQITGFFNNTGSGLQSTGASILYMDSGDNVNGGISSSEQAIIDGFSTQINNFVGSGGGLFSMAQDYGWLSALVPGLTTSTFGIGGTGPGVSLTAAGNAAFPGLTNSDLSTGPYHKFFSNTGVVPVLGVGSPGTGGAGQAIILGGGGGSITNPTIPGGVPEAATWMMMIAGFGAVGMSMRRHRRKVAVSFS